MSDLRNRILHYMRTAGRQVTASELTRQLDVSHSAVVDTLRSLRYDGVAELLMESRTKAYYRLTGPDKPAEELHKQISPEELEKARARVKIGDRLRVWDENTGCRESFGHGAAIVAEVVKKYPHIVQLDNGHSVTYVQLAMYYRETGRGRCIR